MSTPLVSVKRWCLRAGAGEDALVAVVRDKIVPHYRQLDPEVRLGLHRLDDPGVYLASQHWSSCEHRDRICAGTRYDAWFVEYLPILARFDALAEFVDEWEGIELL